MRGSDKQHVFPELASWRQKLDSEGLKGVQEGNVETPALSRTHRPCHSTTGATAFLHRVCVQTSSYLLRRGQLSCSTLPLSGRTRDLEELEDKGGYSEQCEQGFKQVLTRVPTRLVKGGWTCCSPLSTGAHSPSLPCTSAGLLCRQNRKEGAREGGWQQGGGEQERSRDEKVTAQC